MISVTVDSQIKHSLRQLRAGDELLLSGCVFTARDAAHKRLTELLEQGKPLPIELEGAVIYYAGPTQTPKGLVIGSCGPTTSCRMDGFAPALYDAGMAVTIGKGGRGKQVAEAIKRNGGAYLCALGGCGALAAKCVKSCDIIAFEQLGCEAIRRLEIVDFPLIVGIDCLGNSVFDRKE